MRCGTVLLSKRHVQRGQRVYNERQENDMRVQIGQRGRNERQENNISESIQIKTIAKMIIGHIAAGLLVQYFALRTSGNNQKLHSSIPSWCTVLGATLSDILTGTLVLLGIEHVRSNPSITPIGLSLVNIDWSHSFAMIFVSAASWATFCSFTAQCTQHVWSWSFIAVLTHLLGDWLVHNHDMAIYPNAGDPVKYGLGLWADVPRSAWFGELLLIVIGSSVISTLYGKRKLRSPTIVMLAWHLMNYPGVFTNIPYTLGRLFQNNPHLLRLSIGVTFIATYLLPGVFVSYVLDRDGDKLA